MQSNKKKKKLFIPFINNEHFTYTRIKVGKHKSYSENVHCKSACAGLLRAFFLTYPRTFRNRETRNQL